MKSFPCPKDHIHQDHNKSRHGYRCPKPHIDSEQLRSSEQIHPYCVPIDCHILDMEGHSITVASGFTGRPIVNRGTLAVTGRGIIDASASETGGYGAIDNYGTLTIENGTYTGSVDASGASVKNCPDSVLTIWDGTFSGAVTVVYNVSVKRKRMEASKIRR